MKNTTFRLRVVACICSTADTQHAIVSRLPTGRIDPNARRISKININFNTKKSRLMKQRMKKLPFTQTDLNGASAASAIVWIGVRFRRRFGTAWTAQRFGFHLNARRSTAWRLAATAFMSRIQVRICVAHARFIVYRSFGCFVAAKVRKGARRNKH